MPFKPGQSGNPNGAPKRDWTWSGELQKAVEKVNAEGTSMKEVIAESLAKQALAGNVPAANALMDRMDGKPQVDITSAGEAIKAPVAYIPEEREDL